MIRLENVSKQFKDLSFTNVNYEFADRLYQLNGENGSGKSVLLKIIAGLDRKITGQVQNSYAKRPRLFLTDVGIGLPYLDLRDNIELSAQILGVDLNEESFLPLFREEKYLETLYAQSSLGNQNKVGLSLLFSETRYSLIVLDETLMRFSRKSRDFSHGMDRPCQAP
ncbi:ATP-binding cassette domain-containing protein [Ligilactobacillus faecis]|uniref:ATP-binding cassette domain-containing protein n=1 Tax=Ligilactobacillus faecis TaxID=762833 RepID=A0ABV4DRS5_9LACO